MSKIFKHETPKDFHKKVHNGALDSIKFECSLKDALKGKERFVRRDINAKNKIVFNEDLECH